MSITEPMQTAPEQQGAPFEARPVPLFRIDPGWPFVIAGLLLLVAGVLIPAQRDLQELRNTLEIHRALEDQSIRQLAAYDRFLNDLEHGDEQLVGRLAASQLNLMPKDERSMLLVPSLNATVTQWIEDSEPAILPNPPAYPDTLLSRLATGPRRLWVLACGAFLVFVGLMLSPSAPPSRRGSRRTVPAPSPEALPAAAVVAALPAVAGSAVAVEERATVSRLDSILGDSADEAQDELDEFDEIDENVDENADENADEIDDTGSCVDGDPVAMPECVLASDAEAVCMAAAMRGLEHPAAVVEPKPSAVQEADAIELPRAEADETLDAGAFVASVARAETEEIPGEVDTDGDDEEQRPSANDRALDSLSLFHGICDDRWISTADRA